MKAQKGTGVVNQFSKVVGKSACPPEKLSDCTKCNKTCKKELKLKGIIG